MSRRLESDATAASLFDFPIAASTPNTSTRNRAFENDRFWFPVVMALGTRLDLPGTRRKSPRERAHFDQWSSGKSEKTCRNQKTCAAGNSADITRTLHPDDDACEQRFWWHGRLPRRNRGVLNLTKVDNILLWSPIFELLLLCFY